MATGRAGFRTQSSRHTPCAYYFECSLLLRIELAADGVEVGVGVEPTDAVGVVELTGRARLLQTRDRLLDRRLRLRELVRRSQRRVGVDLLGDLTPRLGQFQR